MPVCLSFHPPTWYIGCIFNQFCKFERIASRGGIRRGHWAFLGDETVDDGLNGKYFTIKRMIVEVESRGNREFIE